VTIVRALGDRPRYLKAELMAQASDLLAAETDERHRRVVIIVDEAHLLQPDQLEELRLLTLCRGRGYPEPVPGGAGRRRPRPAAARHNSRS
jgi:type II secretory pathway predicted ATPase ExeA